METEELREILSLLRAPFPPETVAWKPQTVTRDRKRCLAVPYVETQPYQDRLDAICPDWQDTYDIYFSTAQEAMARGGETWQVGKVMVRCRLTLAGITRSDVGECALTDDNALTSAKAQAFKRACSAFGLGRSLYDFPLTWVGYDGEKNTIVPSELKRLQEQMRALHRASADGAEGHAEQAGRQTAAPAPAGQVEGEAGRSRGRARAGATLRQTAAPPEETQSQVGAAAEVHGETGHPGEHPIGDAGPVAAESHGALQDASVALAHESPDAVICPLHGVPLVPVLNREGKQVLLHRVEGEGYCNGQVVRPATKGSPPL